MNVGRIAQGVVLVAVLAAGVGCSAASVEPTGRSSSKLLAPRAFLRVSSSPATRTALGVTEWRMFGGKSRQVLTGYDANGQAVRGVEIQFVAHTRTTRAHVAVKHLDGSGFAFKYDFKSAPSASGTPTAGTKAFLQHAVTDIKAALVSRGRAGSVSKTTAGLVPLAAVFGDCGDAVFWSGLSAAGCGLAGYSAVQSGGVAYPVAAVACSGAAWYGADAYNKCSSSTTSSSSPSTPQKEEPFCDPGGSGFCTTPTPTSDSGQAGDTKTADNDPKTGDADPKAGAGDAPDPGTGVAGGVDPDKAASATEQVASNDTCSSCASEDGSTTTGSDITPSEKNGDVQLADASDTGSAAPAAPSGDVETASFRPAR